MFTKTFIILRSHHPRREMKSPQGQSGHWLLTLVILSLFCTFFSGCIDDDDEENELGEALLPEWRSGYTWVYEESFNDDPGNADWYFIDHVIGQENVGGLNCHVISTKENLREDRYFEQGQLFVDSGSLNVVDENSGKVLYRDFDFPLYNGKTWFNSNTESGLEGEYHVEIVKGVVTPAGIFDCYCIQGELSMENEDSREYQMRTIYYSPEIAKYVKTEIIIEHYDGETGYSWTILSNLIAYGLEDSDGDFLADTIENEIYHTDPENADTDGDWVMDCWDLIPTMNMHLTWTIIYFETADNDEWDNGIFPSSCDPFFILELLGGSSGTPEVFETLETDHFQDQDRIEDFTVCIDIPDHMTFEGYGSFDHWFNVYFSAWDDDDDDLTDLDGDDEVNINDDDNDYICRNFMDLSRGVIMNLDQLVEMDEGEVLQSSGSDDLSFNGNNKGGSISYTLMITDGSGETPD